MIEQEPVVVVIDDDESFRRSVERLINSAGFTVRSFATATEFVNSAPPDAPTCLVLDVRMPGLSGLDLQRELATLGREIPIIFITAHGDISTSVRAMKAGASDFLTKPFQVQELLHAIEQALTRSRATRQEQAKLDELLGRYQRLTSREREVMTLVVAGMLNKQIAANLGTTEKTIKFHRGHLMRKMQAASVADLVRMAGLLRLPGQRA